MTDENNPSSVRRQRIADNFNAVIEDVQQAVSQCGRSAKEVTIVGVTKYVDAATTADLVAAGCASLGENRPQVLWQKAESVELNGLAIDWHMIGHVQRNKLRRLMRFRPLIHSVDSPRLLDAIGDEATLINHSFDVLLEVNISGDETKTGLSTDAIEQILQQDPHPLVNVRGLMAMAGHGTGPSQAQAQFARVRSFRDSLEASTGASLPELSMGMSGDFAQAIAEGATLVRIGSRLFDGVI